MTSALPSNDTAPGVLTGVAPYTVNLTENASGGVGKLSYSWTMGDGTTLSGRFANHTYTVPGLYHVNVNVSDGSGDWTNDSIWINVTATPPPLYALASSDSASGPAPLTLNFSSDGTGGGLPPYTYLWTFGDGSSSTLPAPEHTYAASGTYPVWFYVTDATGRVASSGFSVDVRPPALRVDATASRTGGAAPLTVSFTSSVVAGGAGAPYTYAWSFGDGSSSSLPDPTHTYYASSGRPFVAVLNVSDADGYWNSTAIPINVTGVLDVGVTASPTSGLGPLLTDLSATVTGGSPPYRYVWSFGDGAVGSGPSVVHTYPNPGRYLAVVTVSDALGHSAIGGVAVSVGSPALTVGAYGNPTNGTSPLYVTFGETVDGGVPPYTYAWTLGNGVTSTSAAPSTTYIGAGTFLARLNVTDATGQEATSLVTVRTVGPGSPLAVSAAVNRSTTPVEQNVEFFANASGGVPPYSYSWNFGDGQTGFGVPADHSYVAYGSYWAQVTVTDLTLQTATAMVHLRVDSWSQDPGIPLQAVATAIPSPSAGSLTYQFSGSAIGGFPPYSFVWSFGDRSGDVHGPSSVHQYSGPGSYVATLTVRDAQGNSSEVAVTVTLNGTLPGGGSALEAQADVTQINTTAFPLENFSASATGGTPPYTYFWSFGDGSSSNRSTALHDYNVIGNYAAVLTVTDAAGHTAQAVATVAVWPDSCSWATAVAASATVGVAPFNVTFTGQVDEGQAPYSYTWYFGDSTMGYGPTVSHVYSTPGIYDAYVNATDSDPYGCYWYHSTTIVVLPSTPPLTAVATFDNPSGPAPFAPTFAGQAIGGTGPYAYRWNFGDGSTATSPNGTHVFSLPGLYIVNLTVTDSSGSQATATYSVYVGPPTDPLDATIDLSATEGIPGLPVSFGANVTGSQGGPDAYRWTLANGTTISSGATGTWTFAAPGTYRLFLWVRDPASGREATSESTIVVLPVYPVTLSETGLPAGTVWSVTLGGHVLSGGAPSMSLAELNGTYALVVEPIPGFSVQPGNGNLSVAGSPINETLAFQPIRSVYLVAFTEVGLPSGTDWSVELNGTPESATTATISFSEPNGSYPFVIGPIPGYAAAPVSGAVPVSGSNASETISFSPVPAPTYAVTFTEAGLRSGTPWSVTLSGRTQSTTTSSVTFTEPNGTYVFSIGGVAGYTVNLVSHTLTVRGAGVSIGLAFSTTSAPVGGSSSLLGGTTGYLLLGGIAAIAIAAGVWIGWRRSRGRRKGPGE